ncbi:putative t-complex protein 1 subunit beta protein [Botrytis fragariae]|uniref:Putative t-complex protein 1 subunit beta protein n=1 Tax=Botrytis fragariae TaxID=1964551 RepID=A0A8H6B203_9HELO|nr:putative t-complex protein 1 subunit beta protein [Botrytis fragariae]KAF5877946.1 putative t-complex protein 1 subunit beta protein [Botrytis fragariae]
MDMPLSSRNGGESSRLGHIGQQSAYATPPSFGLSSHSQRIANHAKHQQANAEYAEQAGYAELVTKLQIRIAVLENDLAHATKDKDEAIKSSVIIARALGSVANNSESMTRNLRNPDAEELEELRVVVPRLRRENAILWERIESRQTDHMPINGSLTNAGFKGKNVDLFSVDEINHHIQFKPRTTHSIIDAAIKKISTREESRDSHHPVDFSEATHVPNTVNLERGEDGSLSVPPNFPILPTTQKRKSIHDYNTSTLDDVLASDDEDAEPVIKIEDQLLFQQQAHANFINFPAPAVLKAGFELSPAKAVRGHDYAHQIQANRNVYYDRFNTRNSNASTRSRSAELPDLRPGTTIWTTPQQRDGEIMTHMGDCDPKNRNIPDYFRYGILYVPASGDDDILRGVHIGGIPEDMELRDVLARVRGGRIYSAVLLDTMKLTGSKSALITFINQEDAKAYVEYANAHPITLRAMDLGGENVAQAIVTHIHTPTYPFSPAKFRAIFELNRTRILTIPNFPPNISLRTLVYDLRNRNEFRANSLLEWYIDDEGTLRMEFSSMDGAGSAFGLLTRSGGYRDFGLILQFERDNCEGDLQELWKEPEKRRPMFPPTELGVRTDRRESRVEGMGDGSKVDAVVDSVLVVQRKRLAALQRQHDVIPSLRGSALKAGSWADEVEEELGDSTSIQDFGRQDEDTGTIRHQPHRAHSSTGSTSTLIGASSDDPQKDEDPSLVTPKRAPRIISGKQWLLEVAAAEASSQNSSTPSAKPISDTPALVPDTPTSNNSTPRPRLIVSTTSLPQTTTTKSASPSSAEYSIHSFASSAVSAAGDDNTFLPFSHPRKQTQAPLAHKFKPSVQSTGPRISAFQPGQPRASLPSLPINPITSTTTPPSANIQALQTFKSTIENADTKVYFDLDPEADSEKAILESEVESDHEVRGTLDRGEVLSEGKGKGKDNAVKINPDEIDLDGESDVAEDENEGLFQKELVIDGKAQD